jgi:hypothetical protein
MQLFVVIVFRQAREHELDCRSAIIPLAIVAYVAHLTARSIRPRATIWLLSDAL